METIREKLNYVSIATKGINDALDGQLELCGINSTIGWYNITRDALCKVAAKLNKSDQGDITDAIDVIDCIIFGLHEYEAKRNRLKNNTGIRKIAITYRILDEHNNDITPQNVSNEVTTNLGVEELNSDDYFGLTYTICRMFNRIGEKILIRHLFPRNPRKVPKELCSSDPDKFSYIVQEYSVGRSEF